MSVWNEDARFCKVMLEFNNQSKQTAEHFSLMLREAFNRGVLPFTVGQIEEVQDMLNKHVLWCECNAERILSLGDQNLAR